jgi:hypothetical protein
VDLVRVNVSGKKVWLWIWIWIYKVVDDGYEVVGMGLWVVYSMVGRLRMTKMYVLVYVRYQP